MSILLNYPFCAAMTAIILAQLIKIPLHYIGNRVWNFNLLFSTGGMPSSHSAAVASLSTAIGLTKGVESPLFGATAIFSIIIMFDAAGVRRHAGEQAVVLNRLVEDFNQLIKNIQGMSNKRPKEKMTKLKEVLGHQPIEVLAGGLLGILVGTAVYYLYY